MDWDLWNHWNHTLHSTNAPMELKILRLIDKIVSNNLKKVSTGIPLRCHFLFRAINHYLLTLPVLQLLSWIASAYSVRIFPRTPPARTKIPDADELLLGRIYLGRLIPYLFQLNKPLDLRITVGHNISWSLFVEREEDHNPLTEHGHKIFLTRAWEPN